MTLPRSHSFGRFVAAGLLLGVGLGGFVDGIVLHQILQWHHMLSSTAAYPPTTLAGLEVNTLADGLFHAATWIAVTAGVLLLWETRTQATRQPARRMAGLLLAGWGAFNLTEGVIDHHILGVHHVRAGPDQLAYDLGFLALGAVLVLAGWWLYRSGASAAAEERPPAGRAQPRAAQRSARRSQTDRRSE